MDERELTDWAFRVAAILAILAGFAWGSRFIHWVVG